MKYFLIMNPGSRSGKGKRLWETWESGLNLAKIDYECVFTDGIGHAVELARTANADIVVAVGGDGTINEVLDGMVKSENSKKKMGVLYSGTSPDYCRFHGIPIDPKKAINALLSGKSREVDVARILYHNAAGQEQIAHFGCSCNIGMGASVARFANKWRKYFGDTLGTGLGLIFAIARNAHVNIDLEVDGNIHRLPAVNNLTIAKNPFIASGLKLNLDLNSDDGKLMAFGIHGRSRTAIFKLLPKFYSGSGANENGIFIKECSSVLITSNERQEIEFDGDPRGFLPAHIMILPKSLTLIGGTNE